MPHIIPLTHYSDAPLELQTSCYNTRQILLLYLNFVPMDLFFPRAIKMWNMLPKELFQHDGDDDSQIQMFLSFKRNLLRHLT